MPAGGPVDASTGVSTNVERDLSSPWARG